MCPRPSDLLPGGDAVRRAAQALTTPLLPDDYLTLLNPLWSARELRGRVERVEPETEDTATLVIRPGWGWSFDYRPGQYVGIGVDVGGRWHWRSYSLTSPPQQGQGEIAITVKAMPEGFLSEHLVGGLAPGTIVRLAQPQGDFVLPDPPPDRLLFLTGGSGITPVMGMLRTLHRRVTMPDVVLVHSAPTPDEAIFRDELQELAAQHDGLRLHEQFTKDAGRFHLRDLDDVCPDWRERHVWACGPEPMLDDVEAFWDEAGVRDRLHVERFAPVLTGDGEGGHVLFAKAGREADVDGATTLLEAGEEAGVDMPFGCRMGICHTCVVPLVEGTVRDLRDGAEHGEPNQPIQTCVSAPAGDCVINV